MKVSYEWLKEIVNINVTPEEIARKFLLSGLEVETIIKTGIGKQDVVVVEILDFEKHPKSDALFVTKVDAGNFGQKQIITNLQNLTKNQKLLAGLEGVTFKSGIKLNKTKIKEVDSEGMFARWEDIGFPLKGDYAIFIDNSTKNGTNYLDIGNFEDTIIDVELTANRGDCLGMYGIAREVSTVFKTQLNKLDIDYKTIPEKVNNISSVELKTKNCERYCAGVIKEVIVKPSPLWMQIRLVKSGIRPISNIVDITNYIMMECNQPLHAFDFDKIKDKKIIVRDAFDGEIIKTLDNIERKLIKTDMLIADSQLGHCIGGVMGGQISEVTDKTKNIFLEAAFFKPQNIRKTSKRLGLKSESSYRFERTIDKNNTDFALKRALALFNKIEVGQICENILDEYQNKDNKKNINVTTDWINNKLGTNILEIEMIDILSRLEFIVKSNNNNLEITVPSWRSDVSIKEDIAEEIARIFGFNNITPTIYPSKKAGMRSPYQQFERNLRELMYQSGCDEAFNLSLVGQSLFDKMKLPIEHKFRNIINMDMFLSDDLQGMRNSLIPGMIRTISFNITRQNKSLSLFEIGNVSFKSKNELPDEDKFLSIGLAGIKYFKDHTISELKFDFFDLKGILDIIFNHFKIDVKYLKSEEIYFHPYQQAKIIINGVEAGIIGKIHPDTAKSFDIDTDSYITELNCKLLFNNSNENIIYSEVPKFPSSERDLAIIIDDNINSYDILDAVKKSDIEILRDVRIFDIYKGTNIEQGKYSIAINMSFNKIKSTLTENEIEESMNVIFNNLKNKFNAKIR